MSLLHTAYVYEGSACKVAMPRLDGGHAVVDGRVVRCRHFRGTVHEIGIVFDAPIEVRDYITLDATDGAVVFENVDGTKLTGSILIVDDSELDRRLIRGFLENTGIAVMTAASGTEALNRASEGFDLYIVSVCLPDTTGVHLMHALRRAGVAAHVILSAPHSDTRQVELVRRSRPDAYLSKPVTELQLLGTLAEFLLPREGKQASEVVSTLGECSPLHSQLGAFAEQIHADAERLAALAQAGEREQLKRLAGQVRQNAESFGYPAVSELAQRVVVSLDQAAGEPDFTGMVLPLVEACLRVAKPTTEAA